MKKLIENLKGVSKGKVASQTKVKKEKKVERDMSSYNCKPCEGTGLVPSGRVCDTCKGLGK